ncbi:hypothetical protein BV898_16252 [Hypsibius exemplaris]|uniref:Chromo domain-containing protein n=1 Tax=Hypsibius exemplaris TaxID=2072580 RepID=A0A9X6RLM3_HYPEX|nr:hypothetical protein BV898_16252 [Hypsibius exemplaris]
MAARHSTRMAAAQQTASPTTTPTGGLVVASPSREPPFRELEDVRRTIIEVKWKGFDWMWMEMDDFRSEINSAIRAANSLVKNGGEVEQVASRAAGGRQEEGMILALKGPTTSKKTSHGAIWYGKRRQASLPNEDEPSSSSEHAEPSGRKKTKPADQSPKRATISNNLVSVVYMSDQAKANENAKVSPRKDAQPLLVGTEPSPEIKVHGLAKPREIFKKVLPSISISELQRNGTSIQEADPNLEKISANDGISPSSSSNTSRDLDFAPTAHAKPTAGKIAPRSMQGAGAIAGGSSGTEGLPKSGAVKKRSNIKSPQGQAKPARAFSRSSTLSGVIEYASVAAAARGVSSLTGSETDNVTLPPLLNAPVSNGQQQAKELPEAALQQQQPPPEPLPALFSQGAADSSPEHSHSASTRSRSRGPSQDVREVVRARFNHTLPVASTSRHERWALTSSTKSVEQEEQYEVEKVIGSIRAKGTVYFLVRWKGYTEADNTWTERSCLKGANDARRGLHRYIRGDQ